MIDPSVLAAMAAVRQDDANKRTNFKNAFTFLAPSCPILAKAAKKGRVSFEANVSGATGGKPHQGGLGGDCEKPGKGMTGVALRYHKFEEFKNLSKEQQDELIEWNRANGGKNQDRKKGKCSSTLGSPCQNKSDNMTKMLKSMISEMEACQNKLFEAMADVQTTSVAAIQAAAASPAPSPRAAGVGTLVESAGTVAPEVMIERANAAMLKFTGILKLKDNKA
jgi:hypothetical protein